MFINESLKKRFINNLPLHAFTIDGKDECWPWLGGLSSSGYGYFYIGVKNYRAHRISFTLFIGKIPKNKIIIHTCDNPSCVNPKHLILGSQLKNMQDCSIKERIYLMKLNSEAVKVIKWMLKYKARYGLITKLAKLYKVNHSTIVNIKNNKTWKHIKV